MFDASVKNLILFNVYMNTEKYIVFSLQDAISGRSLEEITP